MTFRHKAGKQLGELPGMGAHIDNHAIGRETLRDEVLAQLRAAMPVDGVVLGLHGAMVADGYDDCEGDLIEQVRGIVGPDAPIGVELDPHCHMTRKRVAHATLIICFKEFPHTDFVSRGEEVVVHQRVEAIAAAVPDMPYERPLMEQLAVLLEETVAKPVAERLASKARLRKQTVELSGGPFATESVGEQREQSGGSRLLALNRV